MRHLLSVVAVFTLAVGLTKAWNIAFFLDTSTGDHSLWSDSIARQLAAKGHDVYVVTANRPPVQAGTHNLQYIHLEGKRTVKPTTPSTNAKWSLLSGSFARVLSRHEHHLANCQGVLNSEQGLRQLLQLQQLNIDLIVYEQPSCLLPFAHLFADIPLVALSGDKVTPQLLKTAHGGEVMSSMVPHYLSDFPEHMGFWRRLHNMALYVFEQLMLDIMVTPIWEALLANNPIALKTHIPTNVHSLKNRVKIILSNTHPSIDYVQPLPPNVVPVAGFHIDHTATESLAADVLEFIGGSKRGCVYVALGSGFGPHDERFHAILDGIRHFADYRFLWELENSSLITRPPTNLLIRKRFSHTAVLGNIKTIAFITNANSLSMIEAAHFGVPLLAVPREKEQFNNAQRAFERGMALVCHPNDNLHQLLATVIADTNPYREAALRVREEFRKRPQTPMDTALWHIEALLMNPESFDHLVSRVHDKLSVFQRYSMDIAAMFLVLAVLIVCNIVYVTRQMYLGWHKFGETKKRSSSPIQAKKKSPRKTKEDKKAKRH